VCDGAGGRRPCQAFAALVSLESIHTASNVMAGDPSPQAAERQEAKPATIDSTFRNGSLTAIGIIVGFSLGFLSRWAALPGKWTVSDLTAVGAIFVGVLLQVKGLADLLSVTSLVLANYNRSVRIFLVGVVFVAVGVVFAIFADVLGYGQNVLRG
jgi:hypothetical protein